MKLRLSILLMLLCTGLGAQTVTLSLENCELLSADAMSDAAVRNAAADVEMARMQMLETRWLYAPSVSLNAFGFRALNPLVDVNYRELVKDFDVDESTLDAIDRRAVELGIPTHYRALQNGWGASALLMQPVFAGGRIVNGNALASLGYRAALLQQSVSTRDHLEDVRSKFWRVIQLQEKLITLDDALGMLSSLEGDAASASDAGLIAGDEIDQVRQKQRELALQRSRLVSGMRLAKMDLLNTIGYPYTPYLTMACDSLPYVDSVELEANIETLLPPENYFIPEEDALAATGESQLLELQVQAKELERRIAIGEALPQLAVGAAYGYAHYIGEPRWNGGVFATLSIPITAWGATARKAGRLGYAVQQARTDRDFLREQLLVRLRQLWVELEVAWDNILLCEESVDIAVRSFTQTEARFNAGMATSSELMQQRTSLRSARNDLIDARIAYIQAVSAYRSYAGSD